MVVGIVVNAVWVEPIETVDVEVVDVVAEVVVLYLFWVTVVVRVFGIDTILVESGSNSIRQCIVSGSNRPDDVTKSMESI